MVLWLEAGRADWFLRRKLRHLLPIFLGELWNSISRLELVTLKMWVFVEWR